MTPSTIERACGGADVEGLGVRLGGQEILRDVTFDVAAGSWVCAIGPNGAGKTTLVHAVAGLVPFEGRVGLWGRETARVSAARAGSARRACPAAAGDPRGVRVLDYVLLGRTPHLGVLGSERRSDLVAVDRGARPTRPRMGGGAAARHALGRRAATGRARARARAGGTAAAPRRADDRSGSGSSIRVLELVDELRREHGLTVLSTMHDLTLAGRFADRFALLSRGRWSRGDSHGRARRGGDPGALRRERPGDR